jgi:hypothetical protein
LPLRLVKFLVTFSKNLLRNIENHKKSYPNIEHILPTVVSAI